MQNWHCLFYHPGVALGLTKARISNSSKPLFMLHTQHPAQGLYLDRRGATENLTPYAHVNRALFGQLARSPAFKCVSREDAPSALKTTLAGQAQGYVTLTHSLLTAKSPLVGSSITIPYFDAEVHAERFYEQCKISCDDIWFTSEKTRLQAISLGIATEQTFLLNLGFDPSYFTPLGPKLDLALENKYIFLYIGSLDPFSEICSMLEAYVNEFSNSDPVILLLQLWPSVDSRETESRLRNLEQRFQRPGLALVARLHGEFDDTQAAALYRTAHVMLHPQRHDYSSLQLIEAAATALPVLKPRRQEAHLSRFQNLIQWIPESCSSSQDDDVSQWRCIMRYASEALPRLKSDATALAGQMQDSLTWKDSVIAVQDRILHIAQKYPLLIRRPKKTAYKDLLAYEGMVFSQNGEDGMLYELFNRLGVTAPYVVEIGTETGAQCNGAFWVQVMSSRGLLIEANPQYVAVLHALYADYPTVTCIQHFVTSDSIAELLAQHQVPRDMDLLSIDIDGNDFYIWLALGQYRPKVVIIEYNAFYPPPRQWVMSYNSQHTWNGTSYYGASLTALVALGNALGYNLLCCNSTGVNAIFLRADLQAASRFPIKDPQETYRPLPWSYPHEEGPSLNADEFTNVLKQVAIQT